MNEAENLKTSVAVDRGTPMLTTYDNPFNPFEDFTSWLLFDTEHGYNCCGYVGRMAATSPGFTDRENNQQIEEAIDNLLAADFMCIYRKVYADSYDDSK